MSCFRLADQAKADLDGIWDYLGVAMQSPAAAQRQLEVLFDKFVLLSTQPLLGECRDELRLGLRAFVAGSYVIFYTIGEGRIEIERVIHSARDIDSL